MSSFYKFKAILLGTAAVGKTSLLHQYINGKFADNYAATIGVDFLTKEVKFRTAEVKITIWDLAGQAQFKFLRKNFYTGSHGALLIFDLTREETFREINSWYLEMREFSNREIPFIVIGNKLDLTEEKGRAVPEEEVKKLCNFFKSSFYLETSAKTGENVEAAFKKLIQFMAEAKGEKIE
ncbi:MAG: Rab family GTPase [Promethearchaeota archaeon]